MNLSQIKKRNYSTISKYEASLVSIEHKVFILLSFLNDILSDFYNVSFENEQKNSMQLFYAQNFLYITLFFEIIV